MLLTVDGVTEPELKAVVSSVSSFDEFETKNRAGGLFEELCQARVVRGVGTLERSQRLGPRLAQRIIDTFDDSFDLDRDCSRDGDFILN